MSTALDLIKPRLWPVVHRRPAAGTRRLLRLAIT